MTGDGFVIRPMTRAELDTAVEWAAAEGWNPGMYDAEAFYAADPGGFYAGLLNGELSGSISAVRYASEYAFIGFFIVKPEHRGRKYGLRLWLHAIEAIGDTPTGLDGVLAQTGNYARSGFMDAYHNQRYQGVAAAAAPNPNIATFDAAGFEALEEYDRGCFPGPRRAFLKGWLGLPGARALVYRDEGGLGGYGVIRPARDGYRVGPLFADDPQLADVLFDALVGSVPESSLVFIDVPQVNPAALSLVTKRSMTPVFETARMYRGPAPSLPVDKVFGVTTLELG